ncbi:hypothetical protein SELMODRAFT_119771 [Selaginella moellendorffii]|uniref:NmrA-like domain-containing protein n=1 Tax=Selaginella moellendorffii TaxID=88036 RepID=D8SLU3_SELML|nr:hypothetical protein SELMODRAFT_119771 [Selaginella moellendorffii]
MDGVSKSVLVIGATGYIGRYIALASAAAGFSTSALLRANSAAAPNPRRDKAIESLHAAGISIKNGSLDDRESLMLALEDVDIVISAVGIPQILEQLNLVEAMKEKKTVKRFVPSEFGQDVDKVVCLKPAQEVLSDPKIRVRRAIEAAGIPFTYVITNAFAKFHFNMREENGRLSPPERFVIYGDGNIKASFVTEEDIGAFTVKAAADPRALNKTLHMRPPANALSQNETVAILERETKRQLRKEVMSQVEMLESIRGHVFLAFESVILSLMYSAYIRGDTFGFELGPNDVVAHELYPDASFTDAHGYLSKFV